MHTSAMECSHLLLNHEQHLSAGKESSDVACVQPPLKMQWQDVPCLHFPGGHPDVDSVDTLYTVQVDTMMWTPCTLSRSRCLLSVSRDVSL